jgi:hypothetical protein
LVADHANAFDLFRMDTAHEVAELNLTRVAVGRADADEDDGDDQRDEHIDQDASCPRVIHGSLHKRYTGARAGTTRSWQVQWGDPNESGPSPANNEIL